MMNFLEGAILWNFSNGVQFSFHFSIFMFCPVSCSTLISLLWAAIDLVTLFTSSVKTSLWFFCIQHFKWWLCYVCSSWDPCRLFHPIFSFSQVIVHSPPPPTRSNTSLKWCWSLWCLVFLVFILSATCLDTFLPLTFPSYFSLLTFFKSAVTYILITLQVDEDQVPKYFEASQIQYRSNSCFRGIPVPVHVPLMIPVHFVLPQK